MAAEDEYLFAPYATFTVTSAIFQPHPTPDAPHMVVVCAAVNNLKQPEDVLNAPWA